MSKTTLAHKPGYLDSHKEEILRRLNEGEERKDIAKSLDVKNEVLRLWMKKRDVRQVNDGLKITYVFGENSLNKYEMKKDAILKLNAAGKKARDIAEQLFGEENGLGLGQLITRWKKEIS